MNFNVVGYRTRSMEALLIKDLLFIFQGIDGFVLKAKDDKYEIYSKVSDDREKCKSLKGLFK